jgi:hypothetical protein
MCSNFASLEGQMRVLDTAPLVIGTLMVACNHAPGAPAVVIVPASPLTGDDLVAQLSAEAPDEDGDSLTYTFRWYSDGALVSGQEAQVLPAAETAKGQVWKAVVTATDGDLDGPPAEASVFVGNTAPAVEISLTPSAPAVTEDLVVSTVGTDADGDPVEFEIDWLVGGESSGYHDLTLPAAATARGEVWTVQVTPTDGEDSGEPATASVSIANAVPRMISASLGPADPTEASTLEVVAEAEDDDGDALSFSYAWQVDGSEVLAGDSATLSGEHFAKGQAVLCLVTASDGMVDSPPLSTEAVTVLDTAPTLELASVDPGVLLEGSTARCLGSGWYDLDGDAEGYLTSWSVGGVEVSTDETIDGALFDRGDEVICVLTPDDGELLGSPVSSAAVTVGNTAPVLASAAITPSAPTVTDELSLSLGSVSDDDGDSVSLAYTWYVDGVLVSTQPSLSGSSLSRGASVHCVVTPSDGTDSGAPLSTAAVTVQDSPPELVSLTLDPSAPTTDSTITAVASGSDVDGDTVSMSYAWAVDGVPLSETGSSLDGALWFDKHQVVEVTVTPSAGGLSGAPASASVSVANSAPSAPAISLSPAEPVQGVDDLHCVIDIDGTDADGDSLSYSFHWTGGGATFSSTGTTVWSGDTVSASDTVAAQSWACTVTPSDGEDDGAPVSIGHSYGLWSSRVHDLSEADLVVWGEGSDDWLGTEVAAPGDVDGDGLADLLLGSPYYDSTYGYGGKVHLILGSSATAASSMLASSADVSIDSDAYGDFLGEVMAGAGDVNGDGLGDFLLGSDGNDEAYSIAGMVYLFLGWPVSATTSLVASDADYKLAGEVYYAGAGSALAGGGDVDGDGLDDFVVGATIHEGEASEGYTGWAYLIRAADLGSPGSSSLGDAQVQLVGDATQDRLGSGASMLGDVDGDGLDDVAIGAYKAALMGPQAGAVYVVSAADVGSAGTYPVGDVAWAFAGEANDDQAGIELAAPGDVDGDGLADLLAGAMNNDSAASNAGRAYLIASSELGSSGSASLADAFLLIDGESSGSYLGSGVAGPGDLDGDGSPELAVGAMSYAWSDGRVYIFLGSSVSAGGTVDASGSDYAFDGAYEYETAGNALAAPGDVDGNGVGDLLIGAASSDEQANNAGAAYLLLTP